MPVHEKKGRRGPKGEKIWRVRIWHEGKQHERLITGGKKKEAEQYEAQWLLELQAGKPVESRVAPPFSLFCVERYTSHAKAHLRASTWSVRRYQLATLIEHLGERRLTELVTAAVEDYKAARTKAGAKPRTVNNELAVLQAVLHHARDLGVPCASPKVKPLPVIGRGRVTFWTLEQLGLLYAAVEELAPDLVGIVVCLANTGMRKGEALALEQSWVDLRRRLIRIEPNEDWQPKDNEPREIPISDALLPWLERALAKPGRYVFPSSRADEPGRPQRWACWPKRTFDRARKAAGRCAACREADPSGEKGTRCKACAPALRGGPHTLRHTFASHFLQAVPDMYLLAQVLGHSETRTSKIYAHLLPTHLERARNAVNLPAPSGPAKNEARKRWGRSG